jgi:hypothetical protein
MARRRFAPRSPAQQQAVQNRIAFAGSVSGRVRLAAPLRRDGDARVPAIRRASAADIRWEDEYFDVTSSGPSTFALAHTPVEKSEDVKLDRKGLTRTTDWVRAGSDLTLDDDVVAAITGTVKLAVHYQWNAAAQPPASTPAYWIDVPATSCSLDSGGDFQDTPVTGVTISSPSALNTVGDGETVILETDCIGGVLVAFDTIPTGTDVDPDTGYFEIVARWRWDGTPPTDPDGFYRPIVYAYDVSALTFESLVWDTEDNVSYAITVIRKWGAGLTANERDYDSSSGLSRADIAAGNVGVSIGFSDGDPHSQMTLDAMWLRVKVVDL